MWELALIRVLTFPYQTKLLVFFSDLLSKERRIWKCYVWLWVTLGGLYAGGNSRRNT
jgi:hypothetical protein